MEVTNIDAWLIICRENANDPLAKHVGCENAGQTAAFLFYIKDDSFLFLKQRMADAGDRNGWAPDQNPNVVSGTDRGHSHATDRIIQSGDIIQTDFGIRVHDTWVTDIQRFAYVLKEDEVKPPEDIAYYWDSAKKRRAAAFAAMKPGAYLTLLHMHIN
jgi:Xaa-Pro aminopeptidase